MLGAKGVKVFAVIDQSAEARQVGLTLRDTTLVVRQPSRTVDIAPARG